MITAIVQGQPYPQTEAILNHLSNVAVISEILVVTSTTDRSVVLPADARQIRIDESNLFPGVGNRNRQIAKSLAGVQQATNPITIKMRSDQVFTAYTLNNMISWYMDNKQLPTTGRNGKSLNPIYTLGNYSTFPFHPRDHLFMGKTEDILLLFDIPLDTIAAPADYTVVVRSETYIGQFYMNRFIDIDRMIRSPTSYLTDLAPCRNEAMVLNAKHIDTVFKPFPKVDFEWPNKGLSNYYFDFVAGHGQYWSPGFIGKSG